MKGINVSSRIYLESLIFWILTPLLSLLVILFNVYRKDKVSLLLFSLVIGAFSFVYIPLDNDDRVRHYERFYEISGLDSFSGFMDYLTNNNLPDSFVYGIMYLLSLFTNDPRSVFFVASTLTTYIFLLLYVKINKEIFSFSKWVFFMCFCLVIFSFNYTYLFSGLRFYVGAAFALLGWYYLCYCQKKFSGFLFLFLAVYSHFATSLVVVSFIILFFTLGKVNFRKVFYVSFFFTLIPSELLFQWISMLPLAGSYISKANDYLMYNDILSEAAQNAAIFKLILLYKSLWVYFILMFVYIYRKSDFKDKVLLNSFFVIISLRNVFSSSPTISQYYDTIALFLSVLFMIKFYMFYINKLFHLFVFYVFGNFILDTYKYRYNFIESNFKVENLTSASLFGSDVEEPLKTTWK
ncbi:EpsG family protein [Myroides profundi]|uniref:EpsG family protein n=1 Tax=Myroides profundi TaxID=480520 RepID=A0AAJ4W713_MYRPR|nr:EpsG family protein [Myroides profundi]AJH15305.1 oligosaccharide repeat unit polymerase Wzy [Myroides profundi]SER65406.1 EpsG family protein [Myroides profundi]